MIINHIITSSLVIVFVLLIGNIFETKISACLKYSLWLLVVAKLLLPISGFESQWHILNFIDSYVEIENNRLENNSEESLLYEETFVTDDNSSNVTNHTAEHGFEENIFKEIDENQELEAGREDSKEKKANHAMLMSVIVKSVYVAGVMVCFAAIIISNLRFYKAFKSKRKYWKTYDDKIPVYKIEKYYGACLYGGFSPVIIVGNNADMSIEQQHMILLHEYVHYAHGDHIWSMIRNLCVALYWYNPLVWLAASASRKDGELACDEGTIRCLGKSKRTAYGQTLLEVISKTSKKNDITSVVFLNSTAATRGKEEMKKRISVIAKGKKTSKIALILTIALAIVCMGCTWGEPVNEEVPAELNETQMLNIDKNKEGVPGTDSNENNSQGIDVTNEDWATETVLEADEITQKYPNAFEEEIILEENKYIWPTVSTTVSTAFGERIHPITGEKKVIDYIGIAGNEGDSVYAVADGDIIDVGFDKILGNYVVLATLSGEEVTYGHLDGSKVPKGAQVKAGDIIGLMGKTGNATGTFLSLTVKENGEAVDPMFYFEMDLGEETITYNGREYKKSELCNATLKWLELSEKDRMLSSYFPPEFMIFEETWGVTLTAENITSTSVTIKCIQSDGNPTGELQTGSWYILETWTKEKGWIQMPYIIDGEIGWTSEAWIIPMNDTCEWKVNWEWLYGAVPSGKYRIGKSIMDFRKSGDFDTAIYYAEFEIKK